MEITIQIDGKPQLITVPDDATDDEIDELVNASNPHTMEDRKRSPVEFAADMTGKFNSGVMSGFDDELLGAFDATAQAMSGHGGFSQWGDTYRKQREGYDQRKRDFTADHPMIATAAEATGGAVPAAAAVVTGGATEAPAVASTLARYGRTSGIGAAAGAASGYGNASPDERLQEAGKGALIGGTLGPAIGGAAALYGKYSPQLGSGIKRIGAYIDEVMNGAKPAQIPQQQIQQQAQQIPSSVADRVLGAFERDSTTPAKVLDDMRAQQNAGRPAGIADVAGANTQGLARATYTAPGAGKQIAATRLNERADAQPGRISADLDAAAGRPTVDSDELSDSIRKQQKIDSKKAYDTAFARGDLPDEELKDILESAPIYQDVHVGMANQLRNVGETRVQPLFDTEGSLMRAPTVEDIDIIKKGLDAQIYTTKGLAIDDATAYRKGTLSAMMDRRQELLARADGLAPEYASARAKWASATEQQEAIELGQRLIDANARGRDIAKELARLTPAQRVLAQQGAMDSIQQKLAVATDASEYANVAKAVYGWGKGNRAKQLEALFGKEQFAALDAKLKGELQMVKTRNTVMGGSQTANKIAEMDDADAAANVAVNVGVDALAGNKLGALTRAGRFVSSQTVDRFRSGITEGVRSEIADQLFNFDNVSKAEDFLRGLEQMRAAREAAMRGNRSFSTAAAISGGGQAGSN